MAEKGAVKPLWEVGVLVAGFNSPEYPAADQQHTNSIIVPYFVYRGEVLRIGDGSARAVVVEKDWIELDLSLNASFNANSDENEARTGMPDLDYLFEVGPQVKFRLSTFDFKNHGKAKLSLNVKARAVFSTDLSNIDQRGYVFQPELSYEHSDLFDQSAGFTLKIAPIWATERLHDYFYQVDGHFVIDTRSSFDANSGYLGTIASGGLSFMVTDNIKLFVFAQLNFHSGAKNENSPLFLDKNAYAFGLGMSWRLFEKK